MITVRNRMNQLLVINIKEEPALIFLAKEKKDLSQNQFQSPEMKTHIDLGNIVVLRISE